MKTVLCNRCRRDIEGEPALAIHLRDEELDVCEDCWPAVYEFIKATE